MESVGDKVVLITGASSGLGASAAIMFAKYGAKLALTGRNTANLEKTADECVQLGLARDKMHVITADVTKDDDLRRIMSSTIAYFKKLDVLVNNAGMVVMKPIEEITMDEVDLQLNVNLRSVIALTKLAIPYLKETKGTIINVSIVTSRKPTVSAVYPTTKAGLDMFTSSLAVELGKYGVRACSVNPGHIKTPMNATLRKNFGETCYPLGRLGEPHEVAYPIVFLASDAASFISGANLLVDGGVGQTSSWFTPNPKP